MHYDIQLSEHFRLSEFLKSTTATLRGIDNTPSLEVVSKLQTLCQEVLEPLRAYVNSTGSKASVPIIIGSGYRCPALNKAVGGATGSQHMTGEACDIHIPDEATGQRWFQWMKSHLRYDQLIWEKSTPSSTHHWIHVSFSRTRCRMQVISNLVKNPKG